MHANTRDPDSASLCFIDMEVLISLWACFKMYLEFSFIQVMVRTTDEEAITIVCYLPFPR